MARYTLNTMTRKQLRSCYDRFSIAILLTLVGTQGAAIGMVAALRRWMPELLTDPSLNPLVTIVINDVASYLPPLLIFPLLLYKLPKAEPLPKEPLDLWEWIQAAALCLGIGYFLSIFSNLIIVLLETASGAESQNIVENFSSRLPFWLTLLTFAFIAPLCEEVLFRGILLSRLRVLGDTSAVVLSALAFGLFHLNLYQLAYAFVLGMFFAIITLLTGSIRDSLLLHMVINGSSVLMSLLPDAYEWVVSLVIYILIFFGFVVFIRKQGFVRMEAGPLPFSHHEKRRACLRSPWFVLLMVCGIGASILMIFL